MEKITLENFRNASVGTWIELHYMPEGFTLHAKSGSSSYYVNSNKTMVVRSSDHWGSGIRECNWYLAGHPRNNSFLFSKKNGGKQFIGFIILDKLTNIEWL